MDTKQVRELAELMAEHGLTELRIRGEAESIVLRKGPLTGAVMMTQAALPAGMPMQVAPMPAAGPAPAAAAAPSAADEGLVAIKSPMVGTFYSSPDPESPAFVRIGSEIEPSSTVCIIEAMKVFNEIKAEVSGVVERILVKDEQAVEFGQPLIMVRPK